MSSVRCQSCSDCAPDGVLRIGLTHYNTRAEVDRLADEIEALASA